MRATVVPKGHFYIPLFGTLFNKHFRDEVLKTRPYLLGPRSPYKITELIPGRLWRARLKWRGEHEEED